MCSKEVAHSRYRVRDAMRLRHGTQSLIPAHLRPSRILMLLEPFLVAPALFQHPIDVTTQLPRGRRRRLGLAVRAQ